MTKKSTFPIKKIASSKYSTAAKLILAFLVFMVLLFLSEVAFVLRNRPSLLFVPYYTKRASLSSKNSNVEKTLEYLGKAAGTKMKEVAENNPQITLQTSVSSLTLPENPQLIKDYERFLRMLDYDQLASSKTYKWAKPFYTLGLLAYRNNEPNLVVPFWQTAIYLAPEWSYFHMELANFYLSQGDSSQAQSQIDFCLQFQNPQQDCREFKETTEFKFFRRVGFWERLIEDI